MGKHSTANKMYREDEKFIFRRSQVFYGAAGKDFDPGTFDLVQRREYFWSKMVCIVFYTAILDHQKLKTDLIPAESHNSRCGVVTVDLAVGIN